MRRAFVLSGALPCLAGLWISGGALAAAVSSPQAGTNLPQVHDSTAGVPLAQLFASLDMLGQWLLPSGPRLQVMSFMTKNGGECTETDQNPDNCPHYALIVSLFDWPSSLIDPALFRGPERLAWKMMSDRPKKRRDVKDGSEYSLDILACEASPYIENGNREYDWHGVRYELDIGVSLLPDKKTGYAHWNYTVKLVRSPDDRMRLTCAGTAEMP